MGEKVKFFNSDLKYCDSAKKMSGRGFVGDKAIILEYIMLIKRSF